jgi:hypothetical protein
MRAETTPMSTTKKTRVPLTDMYRALKNRSEMNGQQQAQLALTTLSLAAAVGALAGVDTVGMVTGASLSVAGAACSAVSTMISEVPVETCHLISTAASAAAVQTLSTTRPMESPIPRVVPPAGLPSEILSQITSFCDQTDRMGATTAGTVEQLHFLNFVGLAVPAVESAVQSLHSLLSHNKENAIEDTDLLVARRLVKTMDVIVAKLDQLDTVTAVEMSKKRDELWRICFRWQTKLECVLPQSSDSVGSAGIPSVTPAPGRTFSATSMWSTPMTRTCKYSSSFFLFVVCDWKLT